MNLSGFFVSNPKKRIAPNGDVVDFGAANKKSAPPTLTYHLGVPIAPMEQRGVCRTNCIDCLDRTNVAQFSASVCALGQQLLVMGVTATPMLEQGQAIVTVLMDMYSEVRGMQRQEGETRGGGAEDIRGEKVTPRTKLLRTETTQTHNTDTQTSAHAKKHKNKNKKH